MEERIEPELRGKAVGDSRTTMTELVLPNDANTHGNILGGKVMHLMDLAAASAAMRHCRQSVVTASVDSLQFLHPVKVGHLILIEAVVNRSFHSSMEVQVEVQSEDPLTGQRLKTCSAFFTFVAIDERGQPSSAPPLIPDSAEERTRYEQAMERRQDRLSRARSRDESAGRSDVVHKRWDG